MNYGNHFNYSLRMGEMNNLSHYSNLSKHNKRKNYIKSYYDKGYYLNPENRINKANKIKVHNYYFSIKSPIICVASLGFGIDNASKFFSFPADWTKRSP